MTRLVCLVLGWIAVGFGLLGMVLPVLPTTPFILLAAFLFARGSPRARAWLVGHAWFGPHIRNWEAKGAISTGAKRLAVLMMVAVFVISLLLGLTWWILLIQFLCMGAAASFVLTRPVPEP